VLWTTGPGPRIEIGEVAEGERLIDARFVPIQQWPGEKRKDWQRKFAQFRSTYAQSLDLLERELNHLKAKNIAIEAYFDRSKIRNDGWPFSGAAPAEPGVIISFTGKSGELSFPCDTYQNWQHNLHAIALALEALRAVDRYGVTQRAEQYKGWAKLPPAPEVMLPVDAIALLLLHSGIEPQSPVSLKEAWQAAARKLHPDNTVTGSSGQFVMLQKAKKALEEAYGW
jgi:hypothetical protein